MRNITKQEIKQKKELKKSESFPIKIGLEIHGYLDTQEKLFCKCKTEKQREVKPGPVENSQAKNREGFLGEDKPNSRICPICTGQPGSKPMLPNKDAMNKLIQIALVLNCKINHNKKLVWQRKHYSWPDLPKGYQNTISGAYSVPCAENGKFKSIRIRECHLEEDPAQWNPDTGKIDYNRSGLPLVEIVTEPDFSSSEQVLQWLESLLHNLSYIKAVRKNAGIKVDVNVSTYGDRVEIKNLNSLQNIKNAIAFEVKRQIENHEKGIEQKMDTLAYDSTKGITIKMRTKEEAEDYRFIPDPDLPIIQLNEKEINLIKSKLPENPDTKLEKLLTRYKLERADAEILAKNLELVDFFEKLSEQKIDAKKYISWITIELLRVLNYNKKTLEDEDIDIKPEHLAELIQAVDKKQLTELKAKQILNTFVPRSSSIKSTLSESSRITDAKEITDFCSQAIKNNPKSVQDFKSGKQEALNFIVGEVMKLSNKRADFKTSRECLIKLLK
jgi:aspartyl-tRNA(Asn)/glutamyl-tRNA(Gln) amidotransferase subunit B